VGVTALLAAGAKATDLHRDGRKATRFATSPEVVRLLVKGDASVDEHDEFGATLLHPGAVERSRGWPDAILEAGGQLEARASHGFTPLASAARCGMVKLCELLLRGANPNAKNDGGDMPLHLAIENPALCAILLRHQANPDLKNRAKKSPRDLAGPTALGSLSAVGRSRP
jgi:ankyrin repeat protein